LAGGGAGAATLFGFSLTAGFSCVDFVAVVSFLDVSFLAGFFFSGSLAAAFFVVSLTVAFSLGDFLAVVALLGASFPVGFFF
jgi:hypothetical protein